MAVRFISHAVATKKTWYLKLKILSLVGIDIYKHIYFFDSLTILVVEKTVTFWLQPASLGQVLGRLFEALVIYIFSFSNQCRDLLRLKFLWLADLPVLWLVRSLCFRMVFIQAWVMWPASNSCWCCRNVAVFSTTRIVAQSGKYI